jgi:hypothetical protein
MVIPTTFTQIINGKQWKAMVQYFYQNVILEMAQLQVTQALGITFPHMMEQHKGFTHMLILQVKNRGLLMKQDIWGIPSVL